MFMIAWDKLPRGTYRYSNGRFTADVWLVSGFGWRWTVFDGLCGAYASAHYGCPTLDEACEEALVVMEV